MVFGIRDLAQVVKFAENAGQAVDPAGFGDYAKAKETIDKQLGVSLDEDLIGQLTATSRRASRSTASSACAPS